ncbi:MAG: type II toxin-antitoxin system Phd/YefM family antitoxin [Acidobacteriota bacterium]
MKVVQAAEAQTSLSVLIAETATSHEPIHIAGEHEHAVLIAEEDWRAIQETIYLLSVPGMRESIRDGMETPLAKCSEKLEW